MEQIPDFIKKQFLEFRKIYRNWFKDISDSFPESKKITIKYYKDHMNDSHTELLKLFFNNVSPYLERIADLDYSFFDNCPEFYKDISYQSLFSSEIGKSETLRKSQMTYLTKLSYMSLMVSDLSKDDSINKEALEKYSPLIIKLLTNIQGLDGTNMENMMKNLENAFNNDNFNEADKNFINENPLLTDLAEEISKKVVIPESFKNITNPQDIFKMMFDKEGKQFMEGMVKTVGESIQSKIKSGKISEKDLFNQAQKMMGTVFKNNPMMAAMTGMGGMAQEETEEEKEKRREEAKKRLRENIKAKRGGRGGK